MAAEVITTDDFHKFKIELADEFRKLLSEQKGVSTKRCLKSDELRKLLGISPGTLQNLRIKHHPTSY